MGWILLGLLIGVPLIEIYLFVELGGLIGTWPTIGLVVLTAIAGSIMLRAQGRRVLARAQEKIRRGEPPVSDLLDGIGLLLAGALLLTPGFLTDGVASRCCCRGRGNGWQRGSGLPCRRGVRSMSAVSDPVSSGMSMSGATR